ncbi:MAG: outer membrane protein [Bdellovibrionales bacterium]
MLKFTAYLTAVLLISLQAQARNGQYDYQQQQPPRRHELPAWERSHYNYFKASMGSSSLGDHRDFSGTIQHESSSIVPINLAYGVSAGNAAFEAELGFSNNDFEFIPSDVLGDSGFGDVGSSKLMFNGFYKTSGTGSNLYVGGGLGFLSVSLDGVEQEMTGSSFATQFILGGEIRTNERTGLFVEYKHLKSIGLEVENDFAEVDYNFKESSLNLGIRMYF